MDVCERALVISAIFRMMAVSFEVDKLNYQSCVCISANPQVDSCLSVPHDTPHMMLCRPLATHQ